MHLFEHPWLDGRFTPVASLTDVERIWTFLAGHTAAGNLDAVETDWRCLPLDAHAGGLEVVLQTHLFAGYPRTINALAVVHELGVSVPLADENRGPDAWSRDGTALCRAIYGDAYQPLRSRIATLHPVLDRWMVETGYGRVLSRDGLTPRERELCVLAVLAGQNVAPQLRSHLRGALHVGAQAAECRAVLDQTAAVWGEQAQREVDDVWERLLP